MREVIVVAALCTATTVACQGKKADKPAGPTIAEMTSRRPPAGDWPCGARSVNEHTYRYRYDGAPPTCSAPPEQLPAGCPTSEELIRDGVVRVWRTFTYDSQNRLTTIAIQTDKRGPLTAKVTFGYTADGVHDGAVDRDADGSVNMTIAYARRDDTIVRTEDEGPDGEANLEATARFDAAGHVTTIDVDYGVDGSADVTNRYEWNGNRLVAQHTEMGDTRMETEYLYECAF